MRGIRREGMHIESKPSYPQAQCLLYASFSSAPLSFLERWEEEEYLAHAVGGKKGSRDPPWRYARLLRTIEHSIQVLHLSFLLGPLI